MKMKRGELVGFQGCLGYDYDVETKSLSINEEGAEVVRYIFDRYVAGAGSTMIARELNEQGITTIKGNDLTSSSVMGIINNEKYKGDYLLQKYYTPEDKRNRSVRNNGEVQSYYITEDHEPIVTVEEWDEVQRIMAARRAKRGMSGSQKYSNRYPLSGMLFCPYCGKPLEREEPK